MTRANDISDTAAEWLIRLDAQTSPEIWDEFQTWIDTDARHRAAFVRLRMAWTRVDQLKMLRPADGTIDSNLLARSHVSGDALASRGLQPLEGRLRKRPQDLVIPDRRRWLAAAAAVATVGFVAWLSSYPGNWNAYKTNIGGRERLALTDGTTVDLNTDTELSTRLSSTRREIRLTRGEALFRVAHDSKRPFYVTAGTTVVRAVGTAFSVRIRDADHVDVLVAEGRVAVGSAGALPSLDNPATLASAPKVSAGEAASVKHSSVSVRKLAQPDVTRKLAWTAGHLAFQGETLEEAVQEFNRYNQRQLAIDDPAILQVRVGGIFLTTDPTSFVAALRRSFGIRAVAPASQGARDNGDLSLVTDNRPPQ
jgi:transmembrane sensor